MSKRVQDESKKSRVNVGEILFFGALASHVSSPGQNGTLVDQLLHMLTSRVMLGGGNTMQLHRSTERVFVFCCGYMQSVEHFFETTSSSSLSHTSSGSSSASNSSALPPLRSSTNTGYVPREMIAFVTHLHEHCDDVPRSLRGQSVHTILASPRLESSKNLNQDVQTWLWLIMLCPVGSPGDQMQLNDRVATKFWSKFGSTDPRVMLSNVETMLTSLLVINAMRIGNRGIFVPALPPAGEQQHRIWEDVYTWYKKKAEKNVTWVDNGGFAAVRELLCSVMECIADFQTDVQSSQRSITDAIRLLSNESSLLTGEDEAKHWPLRFRLKREGGSTKGGALGGAHGGELEVPAVLSTSVMVSYLELYCSMSRTFQKVQPVPFSYFAQNLQQSFPWPLHVTSKLWCCCDKGGLLLEMNGEDDNKPLVYRALASAIQHASSVPSLPLNSQCSLRTVYAALVASPASGANSPPPSTRPSQAANITELLSWLESVRRVCNEIVQCTSNKMVATADMCNSTLRALRSSGLDNMLADAPCAVAVTLVHSMYVQSHTARMKLHKVPFHLASAVTDFVRSLGSSSAPSSSLSPSLSDSFTVAMLDESFRVLCYDMDLAFMPYAREVHNGKPKDVLRSVLTNIITSADNACGVLLFNHLLSFAASPTCQIKDAPAAFLFMVSDWSGKIRDRLTKCDDAVPERGVQKLLSLVHVHMYCKEGTEAHSKLSMHAAAMLSSGWARGAAEDMLTRAIGSSSLRMVAMLQSRLKKVDGIECNTFGIKKCRNMLTKRGTSNNFNSSEKRKQARLLE
jgi:hypothetical protein